MLDCFFLIALLGGFALFLLRAFFARLAVATFDFVRLLLFFLRGMTAVYHRISGQQHRLDQKIFQHSRQNCIVLGVLKIRSSVSSQLATAVQSLPAYGP